MVPAGLFLAALGARRFVDYRLHEGDRADQLKRRDEKIQPMNYIERSIPLLEPLSFFVMT